MMLKCGRADRKRLIFCAGENFPMRHIAMIGENLTFRNAQEHIRAFAGEGEGFMDHHYEAMDCRDCEAFLQMGIDAFEWLIRADIVFRAAAAYADFDYGTEWMERFKRLAKTWLRPCDRAEEWIKVQLNKGYSLDNLEQFRKCKDEMLAIVKFNERSGSEELPEALIPLRDSALEELDNGQAAEFVP
jgi:hypothetical protein